VLVVSRPILRRLRSDASGPPPKSKLVVLGCGVGGGSPFPSTPNPRRPSPPLRCGQILLDHFEHLLHNLHASVASLRLLFTFAPECRSASLRKRCSPSPEYPKIRRSPSCGLLHLLARLDQMVQINFHPQAGALIKWMKRIYLPRFLVPIPSFIWCPGVRFHHWYLFDPTTRDCYRKACVATLGSRPVSQLSSARGFS
jgi:hypothetical protein